MTIWVKDAWRNEAGEFQRYVGKNNAYAKDIGLDNIKIEEWKSAYDKSRMVILNDRMWKTMNNTDSWEATTLEKIHNFIRINDEGGSGFRDIDKVIKEVRGRARCPIVILHKGKYELVAGNTRLMACRFLNIRPKIVVVNVPQ
jgi:hypothetical protein